MRDTYTPDQGRSPTDAVLDAIENYKGGDLLRADFVLYEDIDPDALDSLFRHDARPRTRVAFTTDDVRIELWERVGSKLESKSGQVRRESPW